ncbi:MAG: glycosyltransferase family 39 protein [bacterium]|nr:glycosyltransferase family 39 protein [bacterium]
MKANKKIIIFLGALIIANLAAAYFFLGLGTPPGDAPSYHDAMEFLLGQGESGAVEAIVLTRLLTSPLMLYLSIFFGYFVNSLYSGMMIMNLIFYFLIISIFYFLVYEIYGRKNVALFSTVLIATNYYLVSPANAFLVDLSGWFFMLAASWFAVRYYKRKINKNYYLALLFSVIGVFFKEYGALGLLTLFTLIFLSDFSLKEKIKKILLGGFMFGVLPLAYHIFFYLKFGFSYFSVYDLTYYQYNIIEPNHSFVILIKVLGWVFSFGWFLFFYGAWREYRDFDKVRLKFLISLLPLSLSFLAWPSFAQRVAFVLAPLLAIISGRGLADANKYLAVLLVIAYIFFNYNIGRLIEIINLPL